MSAECLTPGCRRPATHTLRCRWCDRWLWIATAHGWPLPWQANDWTDAPAVVVAARREYEEGTR